MSTRANYRDWLRTRLGIKSPLEAYNQAIDLGWDVEELYPDGPPPAGAQPTDMQIDPSNWKLNSAIATAAYKVTRECRVMNAWNFTDLNIAGVSSDVNGPYVVHLDNLSGFPPNSVVSLKRAYWGTGGDNFLPLRPINLQQADSFQANYMNNGPASPYQYSIEGNLLYLLPGPSEDGVLRMTIGSGVLAPLADSEGYGIPTAYDDAVNYQALLELAEIMPNDTEMTKRARSFTDNAREGMISLQAYWDNVMLDEYNARSIFTTSVTRYIRRN